MQKLVITIAKELETVAHCAIYEPELDRVWRDRNNREEAIRLFAQSHGWRLRFYKEGLVAIFDKAPLGPTIKQPSRSSPENRVDGRRVRSEEEFPQHLWHQQ